MRSGFVPTVLLVVLGILVIYPLVMIFYSSVYSGSPGAPGHFTWQGYQLFLNPETWAPLGTTLWLAAIRVGLAISAGVFFAWVVARTDTPLRGPIEFCLWIYFFLPIQPMVQAWVLLLAPQYGLINQLLEKLPLIGGAPFSIFSYGGIIWVSLFVSASAQTIILAPAFRLMDASLEESSRMSGAGAMTTLRRITIPLMLPIILGAALLSFIKVMESFETELVLGYREKIVVYTTQIYYLINQSQPFYTQAMALTALFVVVVLIIALLYRRLLSGRDFVTVSGRGFAVRPTQLGRWKYVTMGVCLAWLLIGTGLPLGALLLGTLMNVFGLFIGDWFTFKHYLAVLGDPVVWRSLLNSLMVAGGAALAGLLLYSSVSYIVCRTSYKGKGVLDFVAWLPWAVPGMVLALAVLWAYVGGIPLPFTLYGTLWLIMLAYVIKDLPLGVRLMNAGMLQIGKELEESAWIHGASWIYAARRIMAPLLSRSAIAVGMIVFLIAFRELATAVMLYTPNSRLLSITLFERWFGAREEEAMVVGLMMTVVTIGVAAAVRRLGQRRV